MSERPEDHEPEPAAQLEPESEPEKEKEKEPAPEKEPEPPARPDATEELPRYSQALAAARLEPAAEAADPAPAKSGKPQRRRRRDTLPGVPVPRKGIRGSFARIAHKVETRAAGSDKRRAVWPVYVMRLAMQVLRQWARDRCPQQAASLAFQTVLSVVPVLAVSLAVLRATHSLDAQSSFVDFLGSQFIPVSREEISSRLIHWSENVTFESLGLAGLITTVILAFIMINSLERVTNQIWRAERKRSLPQKFVVFYATATIGPFLIALGFYQAAQFGLTEGFSGITLSFATSFGALFLANYFLPACQVRVKPALLGALVSTVFFEVAKHGFNIYVSSFAFDKYAGVYGAVAVAPLFLLWIYYSWLTLLFGIEVAHALQNLHLLERIDRRGAMSLENELLRRVNGVVAARIMVAIAEAYLRGDKVMTRRALETRFDLSDEVLERITQRLKRHDLLIEVEGEHHGYMPARPPSEISLAEVMRIFRGDDVVIATPEYHRTRLDKVLVDIEADTMQRTSRLSLDDLLHLE